MGGQRVRSRPHTVPSRTSKRRDEDFVDNSDDRDRERERDRDDEESSYYSDRGENSYGDRGPTARENGASSSTRSSSTRKRNNSSSSGVGQRRQSGFEDRDSSEDSLAMQTMSLIHGQLTAMKHQLFTISDITKAPESEENSQSLSPVQGQGQGPPSQSTFLRSTSEISSPLRCNVFRVLFYPVLFWVFFEHTLRQISSLETTVPLHILSCFPPYHFLTPFAIAPICLPARGHVELQQQQQGYLGRRSASRFRTSNTANVPPSSASRLCAENAEISRCFRRRCREQVLVYPACLSSHPRLS